MDGQDKFIMRESDNAEVGAREDCVAIGNGNLLHVCLVKTERAKLK